MKNGFIPCIAAAFCLSYAGAASAEDVYTYTGNPYAYANSSDGYSTADKITATLDFTNPLAGTGCYFVRPAYRVVHVYDPLITYTTLYSRLRYRTECLTTRESRATRHSSQSLTL
jgi:hypothetical protein